MAKGKKKFLLKLIVRKPLDKAERYRFKKTELVSNLLNNRGLKFPKILMLDFMPITLEGTKYYGGMIMEYLENVVSLDTIWDELTKVEKNRIAKDLASLIKNIHNIQLDYSGDFHIMQKGDWNSYISEITESSISKLLITGTFKDFSFLSF